MHSPEENLAAKNTITEHFAPFDRRRLTVEAWRRRKLPSRDYLLEGVMCTTSRWLVIGETGVGKTLFGLELGFATSAGNTNFLIWQCVRPCRVMYLDGEMPAETLKERIEAAATIYGNVDLHAYNRDVLSVDAMPPLNTPAGQDWLWREIDAVKPDLIIFDSIMCLLIGPLSEEETWAPMKDLIRQLSSRRIAQVWLHHTGHDTNKGFGTKTKEWEMDTVAMLAKKENTDDGSVLLEFRKARLRTPRTADLFKTQLIRREEDGWATEPGTFKAKESAGDRKRAWLLGVYGDLAGDVVPTPGYTPALVRKVLIKDIRTTMIKRGFLALEDGKIPESERTAFRRAREELIRNEGFASDGTSIWATR
jgi:AAA domain